MTERRPAKGLAERLFELSLEAHESRCHEAAYHALVASMHAAHAAQDVRRIEEAGRVAREQIAWIDANAPEHRLSTASAARHNHPGVYEMLARQADAMAEMRRRRGVGSRES